VSHPNQRNQEGGEPIIHLEGEVTMLAEFTVERGKEALPPGTRDVWMARVCVYIHM
jgi:hypothetical protein